MTATAAVKMLDFGVSKAPFGERPHREGQIVGTPQYLAPEQIEGKAVPQTDQYAIGVVLYVCLTKSLPYQGHASFSLLRAIVLGKFPPPSTLRRELPEKLEGIILRAMRTVPEERFESDPGAGARAAGVRKPGSARAMAIVLPRRPLKAPPKASAHAMPWSKRWRAGWRGRSNPRWTSSRTERVVRSGGARRGAGRADAAHHADAHAGAGRAAPPGARTPAGSTPATPPRTAVSPGDIADLGRASTVWQETPATAPAKRRAKWPFVAGGAVALIGAGWLSLRQPGATDAPRAIAPAAPAQGVPRPKPAAVPARELPPPAAAASPLGPATPAPALRPGRRARNPRGRAIESAAHATTGPRRPNKRAMCRSCPDLDSVREAVPMVARMVLRACR